MRRLVPVRFLAAGLAVASLVAVPLATSASAAVPTATCGVGKIVFSTPKATATEPLTGCTLAAATGGKGTAVLNFKKVTAITGKVTWNKTGTSTLKISAKAGSKAQTAVCVKKVGKGASAEIATGTVTGGSGAALKGLPKGSKFSETICFSSKLVLSLYPGTKVTV
jgi:ribosomal protein S27E